MLFVKTGIPYQLLQQDYWIPCASHKVASNLGGQCLTLSVSCLGIFICLLPLVCAYIHCKTQMETLIQSMNVNVLWKGLAE